MATVNLPSTYRALPIKWLTKKPVWVEQWPITGKKSPHLQELVKQQLDSRHIEPTSSPRNTFIFTVPKKLGKWRLLQDLRAINRVIQPMRPLQPGLPTPSAIPMHWPLTAFDLKDCFFTIPLCEEDKEKFAF
jgi:hypothetical protein